jgi:hypothetical protein
MSEIKVNKISPRTACGTTTLGDSGDTFTIPAGVTLTNSGTANGFGADGAVNWQTAIKTSTFTAVNQEGYFCDTSGGAFTVNLPAGSAGAIVSLADYASSFQTHNLTISANGTEKISGSTIDATLDTEGQSVTLVYADSTKGWLTVADSTENVKGNEFVVATGGTITESGNCRIHTFTGPGTFTVNTIAVCAANNIMSHLIVGGGGGGSSRATSSNAASGGGAGGYREVKNPVTPYTASPLDGYPSAPNRVTVTAQGYPIVVDGGGAGGTCNPNGGGTCGGVSSFGGIVSAGGGGGGAGNGNSGGSGGGAGGGATSRPGGTGNTPPVSPAQGFNGGGSPPANPDHSAGGGGGATEVGETGGPGGPGGSGRGGAGATTSITASPLAYAGGGGGSTSGPGGAAGAASPCGTGGRGGPPGQGVAGTTNRGGGGGGSRPGDGANGGSGIVIIRYKFK